MNTKPSNLMSELTELADKRLNEATIVHPSTPPIDSADLFSSAAYWRRYENTVAVYTDLKGSTKLAADNMWDKSTASIYDAAIEPMARIFAAYGVDYTSIQGDGGFGLFTGKNAVERAVCAAISVQTFSTDVLKPLIEHRWADVKNPPVTGFKTGIATSTLLGRKVGIPRTDHQAPVWAGRAVNYAAKASQQADAHTTIVTARVWNLIRQNDYLVLSCGCPDDSDDSGVGELWTPFRIEHVGPKDAEGRTLGAHWCPNHGDEFCRAVLRGDTRRDGDDVKAARALMSRQRLAS